MNVELVEPPARHPRPLEVINALFHAGVARARIKPELDLCPLAFLQVEVYQRGAIMLPECFKVAFAALDNRRFRVYVENDPRNLDRQAHAGLILPEGLQ